MRYLIVTGMSGAGITSVLHALEDIGYFCVDNLPPQLIPGTIDLWQNEPAAVDKAVFGVDIRSQRFFDNISDVIARLREKNIPMELVFVDCREEELIRRYKMTRRIHPLQERGRKRLDAAILEERNLLGTLRAQADYILDTSDTNIWQNRELVRSLFGDGSGRQKMQIQLVSFGYSRGIPVDCDLTFDVRFLPNPHYVESLREHTGLEREVQEYVFGDANGEAFLQKIDDLLDFLIPLYEKEGKSQLIIGIGCTGGRHRSVSVTERLAERLRSDHTDIVVFHRDVAEEHKPTA